MEAAAAGNVLLQLSHGLLIGNGILRGTLQRPSQVLVGVVGGKVGLQHAETLSVLGDLFPVTLHVLEVLGEVRVGALKDLEVDVGAHARLHVDVLLVRIGRGSEDQVGRLLDGAHELFDLVGVLGKEAVIDNVQDAAEAAAAQLGQLVDAQHLHLIAGAALASEPLCELDHLDVLQADTCVNGALDDGLADIHAAADGCVVVGAHPIVRGELINLDLAKLANVADALALQGAEIGSDTARLEIDNASERLVQKRSDGCHWKVAGFGLRLCLLV